MEMSGIRLLQAFFFNDTATTEIYTLSLHDALPILPHRRRVPLDALRLRVAAPHRDADGRAGRPRRDRVPRRSEEHTSELQSRQYLVCRLLLEKKKSNPTMMLYAYSGYRSSFLHSML